MEKEKIELLKNRCIERLGSDYTLLSKYNDKSDLVTLKHSCGTVYTTKAYNIIYNSRKKPVCPLCFSSKLNAYNFKKLFFEIFSKDEYIILGVYTKAKNKIKVKHLPCGREFMKPLSTMLVTKCGCPYCAKEKAVINQTKTTKELKEEINKVGNGEYKLIGKYKNSKTSIKIKHICGYTYSVRPDAFLRGAKCPKCNKRHLSTINTKTTAEYSKEVLDITNGEYTLKSSYKGYKSYVLIKHNVCGTIYPVTPLVFSHGRRCPICSKSHGEHHIKDYLENKNIQYIPQKKFSNCADKKELSYDFYLPTKRVLIEYQGQQHYKPVELFGGKKQLAIQNNHDRIKREYAIKNLYTLIEIPYTCNTSSKVNDLLDLTLK